MLTERTTVIVYRPLDCTNGYDEVMYRGLDCERFWSRPSQLNLWTAYRAKYGCIDVLETPQDPESNSHWPADVR